MLIGKKVRLRPVEKSDIDYFLKWFNDPEITQFLAVYLPMTRIGEEKWLEDLAINKKDTDVVLTIDALISGSPIGNIGLHQIDPKDRHATFGIVIGNKLFHGEGYGTEATSLMIDYGFQQLGLHKINSNVFTYNSRSIQMHLKLGFTKEGQLRQNRFKNGAFKDEILFGLLREKWDKQKKKGRKKTKIKK